MARSLRPRVLVLLLAGGQGSRLAPLTDVRAKPAMPFGGGYRLIDVALSNVAHSGLKDVWVVVQYEPHRLALHLAGGRPWDLDRTHGGLVVLPPFQTREDAEDDAGGFAEGNADVLARQKDAIAQFGADLVLVLSADHVYRLDFRDLIDAHLAHDAPLTLVTTEVEKDDASRYGLVQTDAKGKVTAFAYKPKTPISTTATAEILLYDAPVLLKALDDLLDERGSAEALGDYGEHLVPHFVDAGNARAFPLGGYWRDVGTLESYVAAHYELLTDAHPLRLDDQDWPTHTYTEHAGPSRIGSSARVHRSLVGAGCRIDGTMRESIVGPGVTIEAGAEVVGSILLGDAVVKAGARVACAVVDTEVTIEADAKVGRLPRGFSLENGVPRVRAEQLVVVGRSARVHGEVRPGARIAPATARATR